MEKILIDWLCMYTGVNGITPQTCFDDLRFDIFDEAMTVYFIKHTFSVNVNRKETWFYNIQELLDATVANSA